MSQPIKGSQNELLYKTHVTALLLSLKGTPALDSEGQPILVNGEVLMLPPSPATLKAVNEFLKQGGIDEEPSETSGLVNVLETLRKFDNEPLYIPERDEARAS